MGESIIRASRGERVAAAVQPRLLRMRPWLLSFPAGYLLGRLINATSGTGAGNLLDAILSLFVLDSSVNALCWISLLFILAVPLFGLFVTYHKRHGRPEALLASLTQRRVESIAAPFAREALAWGPDVTLQLAPNLQAGWPVADVDVIYDGSTFALPSAEKNAYEKYVDANAGRFKQNGTKYMLLRNPTAFSDAPNLTLELRKTKFSVVRYYQENIATIKPRRDALVEEAIRQGEISFPSSFCMHAVVTTKDGRVLVTKRAPKVEYSPGTWSVSVEEQLSADDFRSGARGVVKRWTQRLLLEELAIQPVDYDSEALRLLSVFLEVDTMNCSVAAILPTSLSVTELNAILEAMPRTDYEFTEWRFLSYGELAEELKTITLLHHPSSGYRILLALANRYGAARVADVLFPRG